jgi:GNAT superfamily N-acetyltransferase
MNFSVTWLADKREHIPDLAREIFTQWEQMYTDRNETVHDIEEKLRKRAVKDTIPFTLVAMEGMHSAGSITVKKNDFSSRPELSPWIAGVFVLPRYRRKGLATMLIETAESLLSEHFSIQKTYLYTGSAEQLYLKRGYTVRERIPQKGRELVIMEKDL